MAMTWAGQFNMDFTCFLLLSGLWLAWRHAFSPSGIVLGVVGLDARGDVKVLVLGRVRAGS